MLINISQEAGNSSTESASSCQIIAVNLTATFSRILDTDSNRIKVFLENRSVNLCEYANSETSTLFFKLFPDTGWIEGEGAALEFWAKGNGQLIIGIWKK